MPHTPYKEESDSEEEEEEIAAVEMILETYFMHCDNTYNKLQTLWDHPYQLLFLELQLRIMKGKGVINFLLGPCQHS